MADFVELDSNSTLRVTCKDNETGAVLDLTGTTVILRLKPLEHTVVEYVMDIITPTGGVVEYQFASGDLVPGVLKAEVEISGVDGITTSLDILSFNVRAKL